MGRAPAVVTGSPKYRTMDSQKYRLQEVATPAAEREWLDFPKTLYEGYPNWVCPLDQDVLEVFDRDKNELFADGEAVRWVVRDSSGKVVGRIAEIGRAHV